MLCTMFETVEDGNNVHTKDRSKYGFERVVLTLEGVEDPRAPCPPPLQFDY